MINLVKRPVGYAFAKCWIRSLLYGLLFFCAASCHVQKGKGDGLAEIKKGFLSPPNEAKPGVYWYFMDGNSSKEGMTKDLEAMKKAGISSAVYLEVNVGVPRGNVDLLSDKWFDHFLHALKEAERLDIQIVLGIGPGWTGSGGPWVPMDKSMQHLVSSVTEVTGPQTIKMKLPVPVPEDPFFSVYQFTPKMKEQWLAYYEDVAVLALPAPSAKESITDIKEKALYIRAPFSSVPNVKPHLPFYTASGGEKSSGVALDSIRDVSTFLQPDGTFTWEVPAGKWTIMRFGARNNGMVTRPAPHPGLGFESDKLDTAALHAHLENYVGRILKKINGINPKSFGGLKYLHMDSWEMGGQNWTQKFRQEFQKRRGYDPLPFFPVYSGVVVENKDVSERFLWDLRLTAQELIIEYHAKHVKKYAHQNGLSLSIEPYDMNPTSDLELGSVADIPMGEFWSKEYGYNTAFSCIEATSIGHILGKPAIWSEAFTAEDQERWKQHPAVMKNQGDWAFATGITRFFYHTFQHQNLPDSLRPGMTMGPYGVHWDRNQTWWPMVHAYHQYIARCQFLLQQGKPVADILYLVPEGAPNVFRPPSSALSGDSSVPDRKGFNFDGCAPGQLYAARVENGRIVFPGGASYALLVLPQVPAITPTLLQKISDLVNNGATIIGQPPTRSPSLQNHQQADETVKNLAAKLWGAEMKVGAKVQHGYGKGKVIWSTSTVGEETNMYPNYDLVAGVLHEGGLVEDFQSSDSVRYTHRTSNDWDIYFVSNITSKLLTASCSFRTTKGQPQLWNAVTGEMRLLPEYKVEGQLTTVPMRFDANESFFVVFAKEVDSLKPSSTNFPQSTVVDSLHGPWAVSFDPRWGGPKETIFETLTDWTLHLDSSVRYYSGKAVYTKKFDFASAAKKQNHRVLLNLGGVSNMARVVLNGKDFGVIWTFPWQVDVTNILKEKDNNLRVEVVNLWANRLIGDEAKPDDGIKKGQWPTWLKNGEKRTSGRYTFTTYKHYKRDSELLPSGLTGPVTIRLAPY
jgi:hypothetical protein